MMALMLPHPNPLPKRERGVCCARNDVGPRQTLRLSLPCSGHALRHPESPLPLGERVRVRGVSHMRRQIRQDQLQTAEARLLRQNLAPAERALWFALRDRRFLGLKFRRLAPLGPYIVDFYCAERRLVLEVFGDPNPERAAWLAHVGCRVLRLYPQDVLTNLPGCLQHLAEELAR